MKTVTYTTTFVNPLFADYADIPALVMAVYANTTGAKDTIGVGNVMTLQAMVNDKPVGKLMFPQTNAGSCHLAEAMLNANAMTGTATYQCGISAYQCSIHTVEDNEGKLREIAYLDKLIKSDNPDNEFTPKPLDERLGDKVADGVRIYFLASVQHEDDDEATVVSIGHITNGLSNDSHNAALDTIISACSTKAGVNLGKLTINAQLTNSAQSWVKSL